MYDKLKIKKVRATRKEIELMKKLKKEKNKYRDELKDINKKVTKMLKKRGVYSKIKPRKQLYVNFKRSMNQLHNFLLIS